MCCALCSTNSLLLWRRHHWLPGIYRRRHSDLRAATLWGAGLCVDQWLGWRDSELTCVCSWTGVINGPGDSYPAEESMRTLCAKLTFNCL